MAHVGHQPAAGSVEFTDVTTAARSSTAASPLGRAVLAALQAPPIRPGRPWRWRLHDGSGELWADPAGRSTSAARQLVLACGTALHQARLTLEGLGWTAAVDRLPDPRHLDLLARVRAADRHPVSSGTAQAFRAVLSGRAHPPTGTAGAIGATAPPGTLYRLRATADAHGAGLLLLAPGQLPAPVELRAHRAPDRQPQHAVLYARSDTPGGWLAAGEALSALRVTAATRSAVAVLSGDLLEAPARRALSGLLPGGACPLLILHVTTRPAGAGHDGG